MTHYQGHTEGSPLEAEELVAEVERSSSLIVWNDDVNTFDWVIDTLIEVCHHTPEQAEQCTYLIHFKGKCAVKNGSYNFLTPMKDAILDRGIQCTIESN